MASTDLHPSAAKAIAGLSKPPRWNTLIETPLTLHLTRRRDESDHRFDLLLDAITKISKARATSSDYLVGIASEALEALDQVDSFIQQRDDAEAAAELEKAA